MPATFPKRRPDGSFCVEVALRVDTKDADVFASQIASWFDQWVQTNRYWISSPAKTADTLDFFDDFSGPPSCIACAAGFLRFRLECRPQAKWWNDWLVLRLLKDLPAAFNEITSVEKIVDCPDSPAPNQSEK